MSKKNTEDKQTISRSRRASFDYELLDRFYAGLVLEGWEIKSIRAGSVHLNQGYVMIREGEAFLIGTQILPLSSTSTHMKADPLRNRKLLLHRAELRRLIGATERKGYTIIPVRLYWDKGRAKLEIALAQGKKQHDKRAAIKERDWQRDKHRILRNTTH